MKSCRHAQGVTLVELLVGLAVVAVLATIIGSAVSAGRFQADKAKSAANIRQLAAANKLYAAAHGHYAPWGNRQNDVRWHSARTADGFDARGGYLSKFLGEDKRVRRCPVLDRWIGDAGGNSFDEGAGGYGYNATYIGGRPAEIDRSPAPGASRDSFDPWWTKGNLATRVDDPSRVVMFASSAIARGGGLVETDEAVPYRSVIPGGLGERLTPTVHFRFRGKALIAWADGHISFEAPNQEVANDWNVYGENNEEYKLGWFGPTEWNGFWNPRSKDEEPY